MTSRDTPSSKSPRRDEVPDDRPEALGGPAEFGTPRRVPRCTAGCFSSQAGLATYRPWPIEEVVSHAEGSDGYDVDAVAPPVSKAPAGDDDESGTPSGAIGIDGVGELFQ